MRSRFRACQSVFITLCFSLVFVFSAGAQTSQPGKYISSDAPATSYENVKPSQEDVLKRIKTYQAPPCPSDLKETYEYRISSNEPVPPTLTDTYMCDMYQRITMDLKITSITPSQVSEENILNAFNIYLTQDWVNIAGYRPWTHWNFVRSLDGSERLKLAQQTVSYMKENGVKDSVK